MKTRWIITAVAYFVLLAGAVVHLRDQDRRIEALQGQVDTLMLYAYPTTPPIVFQNAVIRDRELDSLILARLDSLEKRISAGWVWVSAAGNAQVWAKPTTDILARLDSLEARIDSAEVWWKIWRELRLKQFRRSDEKAH